jgi:hypothetical protein
MIQNIKTRSASKLTRGKKTKKKKQHIHVPMDTKREQSQFGKLLTWTKEDLHLQATKKASTNRRHCEARTVLFFSKNRTKRKALKQTTSQKQKLESFVVAQIHTW